MLWDIMQPKKAQLCWAFLVALCFVTSPHHYRNGTKCLLHILYGHYVHIRIIDVFATHSPYKAIAACAGSAVNRPWRRYNRLFIVHKNVACFLWLTHEVAHGSFRGYFKIEVHFHPAVVYVGRHGIPYAARFQFSHAHHKLATLSSPVREYICTLFFR